MSEKNRLVEYRLQYRQARTMLGTLNKLNSSKTRKSVAMTRLNKTRNTLLDEIQRVRWIVWPATGRPKK